MAHSEGEKKKEVEWEFFGPPGALMIIVFLPLTVYGLYFQCPSHDQCSLWPLRLDFSQAKLFSWRAVAIFLGWFLFQVFLQFALPGKVVEGLPLKDGSRLKYKINALAAFYASLIVVGVGHTTGLFSLSVLYDEFLPLVTASIAFSFAFSFYLYLKSLASDAKLAEGGDTGNILYDFFIGHELNPRIGDFDLKVFCELRPGLIGWVMLNLAMAAHQYEKLGFVTYNIILVNAFQFWYVYDGLKAEQAILSTMDVISDGFGFMLVFGDLAWVPFIYSFQARYLASNPLQYPLWGVLAVLALKFTGYAIFRGANGQKDAFRRDPNNPALSHLKYLPTERGTRLLISGWWGIARHINYFGDLLMGLSWCLPCGFDHVLPYFYFIYFVILLIHRDRRDDHNCQKKYGKDWDKYREIVPYRIVPYIY